MKGVGNMEKKLLATYESEKAIVRFYAGEKIQSLDDLNEAIKEPAMEFAKAIRRSNPEIFNRIARPVPKDK